MSRWFAVGAVLVVVVLAGCGNSSRQEAVDPNSLTQTATAMLPGNDDPPLPVTTAPGAVSGYPQSWVPVPTPTTEKEKILNAWAEYWKVVGEYSGKPVLEAMPKFQEVSDGEAYRGALDVAKGVSEGDSWMEGTIVHRPYVTELNGNRAGVQDCQNRDDFYLVNKDGFRSSLGKGVEVYAAMDRGKDGKWRVISRNTSDPGACK